MKDIRRWNVLITGAGSGIGEAIAYEFARRGASLMLLGRRMEKLERVRTEVERLGAEASCYAIDVTDQAQVKAFCDSLLSISTPLDCLVLNAGASQRAKSLEADFSVDRELMELDYFAPVYMVKCLAPMLKDSKETHIAVTSSISGLFGFPLRSAYCAAKHALFGFFESLSIEYPALKVTFLVPGRIRTDISLSARLADGSLYRVMDPGQAKGIPVEVLARKSVKAIVAGRRRCLVGGIEMIMVFFKKFCPGLFFRLAGRVKAV